ncbi:hypothetical protein [Mycolicibacterium canariasense]|nr:hypothetical protein [Mycolicibacterium canariasense]MCV7213509.1 hypothetical protein [Mycolicibacterium canariasense]ORV03934.1 hypothetical protein AWB94_23325 [Mycolicibacterium canariasense]
MGEHSHTHDDALGTRRHALRESLRHAAASFKRDGPEFALAGSYALWVYGGPEPVHDVDFVVAESDVDAAAATLGGAGFQLLPCPEDWLFKAYRETAAEVVVDVLFRINRVSVTAAALRHAEVRDVLAIPMPVLPPTCVITHKLRAFDEHNCDFGALLPGVRAVRESVDWAQVRAATADSPFATAFLCLCDGLGIAAPVMRT